MSSGTAAQPRNYRFDGFELFPNQGSGLRKAGSRPATRVKPNASQAALHRLLRQLKSVSVTEHRQRIRARRRIVHCNYYRTIESSTAINRSP